MGVCTHMGYICTSPPYVARSPLSAEVEGDGRVALHLAPTSCVCGAVLILVCQLLQRLSLRLLLPHAVRCESDGRAWQPASMSLGACEHSVAPMLYVAPTIVHSPNLATLGAMTMTSDAVPHKV